MIDLLPALLWLASAVLATVIIGVTIQTGHVFARRGKHPPVKPVPWSRVYLHLASFILAILPFPVYALTADSMDPDARDFYEAQSLPAALIIIALMLCEVAVMYRQSRNAMESAMDARLKDAVGTPRD